jgi:hypothetical protein
MKTSNGGASASAKKKVDLMEERSKASEKKKLMERFEGDEDSDSPTEDDIVINPILHFRRNLIKSIRGS